MNPISAIDLLVCELSSLSTNPSPLPPDTSRLRAYLETCTPRACVDDQEAASALGTATRRLVRCMNLCGLERLYRTLADLDVRDMEETIQRARSRAAIEVRGAVRRSR